MIHIKRIRHRKEVILRLIVIIKRKGWQPMTRLFRKQDYHVRIKLLRRIHVLIYVMMPNIFCVDYKDMIINYFGIMLVKLMRRSNTLKNVNEFFNLLYYLMTRRRIRVLIENLLHTLLNTALLLTLMNRDGIFVLKYGVQFVKYLF